MRLHPVGNATGQMEAGMKPTATLKDILKPPFTHCGTPVGNVTCGTVEGLRRLADVRGWGFFQYFENGEALQDEFKDFLVAAMNEKWERDFGDKSFWIEQTWEKGGSTYVCPECDVMHQWESDYCPSCGTRLLPSEEETK